MGKNPKVCFIFGEFSDHYKIVVFYRNCRQYEIYVNIKNCRQIVVGQHNDCRHLQTFSLAGNRFDCLGYFGQCCKRGQFAFPNIHLKRSNMFWLKFRKIIYADAFFQPLVFVIHTFLSAKVSSFYCILLMSIILILQGVFCGPQA